MSALWVLKVFEDCDMRCSHPGLADKARKAKIDVNQLGLGEFVVFVNKRKTKIKVYAASQALLYMRTVGEKLISLQDLEKIPLIFSGHSVPLKYRKGAAPEVLRLIKREPGRPEINISA